MTKKPFEQFDIGDPVCDVGDEVFEFGPYLDQFAVITDHIRMRNKAHDYIAKTIAPKIYHHKTVVLMDEPDYFQPKGFWVGKGLYSVDDVFFGAVRFEVIEAESVLLKTPEQLGFSKRAKRVCRRLEATNVRELIKHTRERIHDTRECGGRTLEEMEWILAKLNISLRSDKD